MIQLAPTLAREAVRLAAIAYLPYTAAKHAAQDLGYITRYYFDVPPSQGYLFERDDMAFLAFRGTEASGGSLGDIASNVRVLARRWEGPGRAHLGYVRQYRRLRDDALEASAMVASSKPLYTGGHSMGGAMATVCASDIFHRGWNFAGLITFGAPKSLDREAAATIRCPVARFVNRYDLAPYWPPSPSLVNPGVEIAVDSGGWPGPVSRHMTSRYIEAVDLYINNGDSR